MKDSVSKLAFEGKKNCQKFVIEIIDLLRSFK